MYQKKKLYSFFFMCIRYKNFHRSIPGSNKKTGSSQDWSIGQVLCLHLGYP